MSKIKVYIRVLKLTTCIFLLASCSSSFKFAASDIKKRDVIIFVPGYKGSRLINAENNNTAWLSSAQLIFGGDSINLDSGSQLKPDGVLKKVTVVPFVYEIDIYEECFDSLAELGNYQIVEFGYDWRQSNTSIASKFRELVLDLQKKGAKSISVIAHSMGGLSVAYSLGYSDNLNLDKIVFLGTPFRGTMVAFLDMNRPLEPLPFNEDLYTTKEYISFNSAYEFLPHPGDSDFIDTDQLNSDTIYNLDNWSKYSWGVSKDIENKDSITQKLKTNLERSRGFYDSLDYITAACPSSEILNIQGVGQAVVGKYSFDETKSGKFQNEKSIYSEDGDGLISTRSSSLPSSLASCPNQQAQIKEVIHSRMCNNKEVLKLLKRYFKK